MYGQINSSRLENCTPLLDPAPDIFSPPSRYAGRQFHRGRKRPCGNLTPQRRLGKRDESEKLRLPNEAG